MVRAKVRLEDFEAAMERARKLQEKFPKGSPQVPMTPDELQAKFRTCVRGVIGDASCERALGYVQKLEMTSNIRPLTELLRGI